MTRRMLGMLVVLFVASCAAAGDPAIERAVPAVAPSSTLVTDVDPTTTAGGSEPEAAPPATETTTVAARGSAVGPAQVARAGRARAWTLAPYYGLGAWLDAFDWSVSFARAPENTVGVEAIDHMAAEGVQTVYIQASRWNADSDVIEPQRLQALLDRAHAHGLSVVAWYLPTLVDPAADLRRLEAVAALDIDGLGVDIESVDVDDPAERNRRLLDLSVRLDEAMGDRPLAAIVMEPVVMEDVNPHYWPGYPWAELAPHYDVWMPMGYWTNRRGRWRSAHDYTAENIARIRAHLGQPDAPIHPIGGIGDQTTLEDLQGMLTAATEQRSIGGSIYDYRTTRPEHWELLRSFRHRS